MRKPALIPCFWVVFAGTSLYAQHDAKEIDSLQKRAEALSMSGQNYDAAWTWDYIDLIFLVDEPKIREVWQFRLAQAYIRSRQYNYAYTIVTGLIEDKTKGKDKNKDKTGIARCYTIMAQVYMYKKNYSKAGFYYMQSLLLFNKAHDKTANATIAKVLYAELLIVQKKYNDAATLLATALAETTGGQYYNSPAYIKDKAGLCRFMLNQPGQAETLYLEALADAKNEPVDIKIMIERHLGELYLSRNDFKSSVLHFTNALNLKHPIEENEDFIAVNRGLAKLYLAQGSYKEAYDYEDEAIIAERDLFNSVMLTETEALSEKFDAEQLSIKNSLLKAKAETKKIETEQANLEKNRLLLFFSVAGSIVFVALLFVYLYFRQKKISDAAKNDGLKQKLLLSQMNPHFIFNAINTIQVLIFDHKNTEAVNYLSKFSALSLQILENSALQYISLEEEINMNVNYLVIQQLLYNDNFEFCITTDDSIDIKTLFIPPMLTQPFIENAVKHGVVNKKTGGVINIRFYKEKRVLYFEVSDNGEGLKPPQNSGHRSMATNITAERLTAGKGKKTAPIEINTIMQNGNPKGVLCRFAIPYVTKNRVKI